MSESAWNVHIIFRLRNTSNSSKLMGIVIVAGIHVLAIIALVTALASGQIMKQIRDIQASVAAEKVPPKAPPPPPPDLAKPPPPVAIIPEFSVQQEAPPPIQTKVAPPPAPPKAAAPPAAPTELKAIARTHSLPPYPTISQRLGEQGTTQMQVAIITEGNVTGCKVVKSSGSERLDNAACTYVQGHWRWQPPTREGQPVAVDTDVSRCLESERRSVTTNLSAYSRSEKMNFKKLTIAAAIVSMTSLGAVAPASAQNAAAPAAAPAAAAPDAAAPAAPAADAAAPAAAPDADANAAAPAPEGDKAAAAAAVADESTPYGLSHIWSTGSIVSRGILIVLAIMSVGTWYIFFTKWIEQQRILGQAKHRREEVLDLRHAE